MNFRADLSLQRQSIASNALAIARELEAGRAQAPFQEKLTSLSQPDATLSVRVGILAPTADVAHAILADFLGPDYNVCKVVVPSRLGYSEVLLQERGFLLDAGDGAKEFADVGTFIDAIKATHALETRTDVDLEPLRVKLKGPAHLNGLCLLIPQSLDALVRKPALLSTLADQADWIFLAGTTGTQLDQTTRQTIQLVLDNVTGLQNVIVADDIPPPATPEEWWKGWRVTLSLGLVKQGSDAIRTRLSLLTAPGSELRQYLVESRLLRQLEMMLALMAEETQQAQRQITTRLNLAREGLGGATAAPTDSRKTAEQIRNRFTEELENLARANERDTKAALGPDGDINRRLLGGAQAITSDDIEQTTTDTAVKLTLASQVSHRLSELLSEIGQQRLAAALQQLSEGLECSLRDAEKSLETATGMRHKLAFALPDETELSMMLGQVTRPELRYRSEMPRATLGSRFNAARQGIMGLMILGTIAAGATALTGESGGGSSIRTTIAAFMLPLLVIGFLWTYVSFRKKEQQTLEKEVEKLHDGVHAELRRLVQDLLREQHGVLSQALQKISRQVQQQVEGIFTQSEQQRARDADQQRKRGADQQRSLEQRLERLRDFHRQFGTLQSRLPELRKTQSAWLADWIARFNQGKV
jgi:hypothetical protein